MLVAGRRQQAVDVHPVLAAKLPMQGAGKAGKIRPQHICIYYNSMQGCPGLFLSPAPGPLSLVHTHEPQEPQAHTPATAVGTGAKLSAEAASAVMLALEEAVVGARLGTLVEVADRARVDAVRPVHACMFCVLVHVHDCVYVMPV